MSIASILERNRTKRIRVVIVGDCLRDEWHIGDVHRTAQEAPVPILSSGEPVVVPGGAGNVARQLKHWNAEVNLVSVFDDEMLAVLDAHDIWRDCGQMLFTTGRNPIKRRFFSRGQLLLRQDIEEKDYGEKEIASLRRNMASWFSAVLDDGTDIVILSDYAKGLFDAPTLRSIIAACQERDIPVIADPHCSRHPREYAGVTVFKPNEEYVRDRGGPFEFPGNLYWFKKVLSPTRHLVYTRGAEPPQGFIGDRQEGENFTCRERYNPVDAINVVGAGDCFTAHLAIGMAHGLEFKEACELAYSAGRAYVQRPYNEPVMPCEAVRDIDPVAAKVATPEEVRRYLDVRFPQGRIVFTNGVFRLPHPGHALTLQWARHQGDILIVGTNNDASALNVKPDVFCYSLRRRQIMLASLECVDFVVPFAEDTPERIMEVIRPDVLVKGPDNVGSDIPGAHIVKEVRIAPETGLPHASDLVESICRQSGVDVLRVQ